LLGADALPAMQELFDLRPEVRVIDAGSVEEGASLLRREIEGRPNQLLDGLLLMTGHLAVPARMKIVRSLAGLYRADGF
jgi:hypothetical protein